MSTGVAPARGSHWWLRPAGMIFAAYLAVLTVGTAALLLPIARVGEGGASLLVAAFTATSVVSVTGLATVDTATYWTGFGHAVIFILCEVGGLGVMTLTSLLLVRLSHRPGLRQRVTTGAEAGGYLPGNVKHVVITVVRVALVVQMAVAAALAARFWWHYGYDPLKAAWYGIFHSATAFNNLGYALFSDNLIGFEGDWWIITPICMAIIIGGLGLPVLLELWYHRERLYNRVRRIFRRRTKVPPANARRWTIHTRIMIVGSVILLVGGFVILTLSEWGNPATLQPLSLPDKILGGIGLSVFPRTGGFNSLDIGELRDESWFITDVLMFIGAGPAGTSGGLKVSTVAVIGAIAMTEIRGNRVTHIYDRSIPAATQRTSVAVAAAFTAITLGSIALMLAITDFNETAIITEVVSALGTVGLTTGITPELGAPAQLLEMLLMFIGRLGPVTFAAALALNSRTTMYTLPEERPFIG